MTTPADGTTAWQVFITLLPVITGGIIGITGGLAGTAFGRYLQTAQEKKAFLRSKLEVLVLHVSDIDHWLDRTRDQVVMEIAEEIYEPTPTAKISALATVHFPSLRTEAKALDVLAHKYKLALLVVRGKALEAGSRAIEESEKELTAKNPNDPHLLERVKIAKMRAETAAKRQGNDEINAALTPVLVAKRDLLENAHQIAATL